MDAAFSSLIGHVDASIDHRSQLVSALRAKFGVEDLGAGPAAAGGFEATLPEAVATETSQWLPPPTLPAAQEAEPPSANASESFTDVIAQLDRGLNERQKLINALKGQLSKAAALPKTAAPDPAPLLAVPAQYPHQFVPAMASTLIPAPLSVDPLDVSGPLMPPASSQGAYQSWAPPPPGKRARLDAHTSPAPGGDALGSAAPSMPAAEAGPSAAEAAELAAMKAKMLGNLQAAESIAQAKAPTMALPVGDEEPVDAASMPGGASDTSPGPPQASACPPGTSQEEFEAYRQKCWKEYYEKCAVWQKYYSRAQAEKGKGKGKPTPMVPKITPPGSGMGGKGSALALMASGKPAPQVVRPHQGMVVNPALAGKGRQPLASVQGARQRAEEDIHSKLLGL